MNLNKRLEALETTLSPSEGAWLAFIQYDGTVDLSHVKYGNIRLTSREAFEQWYRQNIVEDGTIQVFIIDIVNCKGEEPNEL